jgi:hypothetical protein
MMDCGFSDGVFDVVLLGGGSHIDLLSVTIPLQVLCSECQFRAAISYEHSAKQMHSGACQKSIGHNDGVLGSTKSAIPIPDMSWSGEGRP